MLNENVFEFPNFRFEEKEIQNPHFNRRNTDSNKKKMETYYGEKKQFETKEKYEAKARGLLDLIRDSDGKDELSVYIRTPKAIKHFGPRMAFAADEGMLFKMREMFGEENVKVV